MDSQPRLLSRLCLLPVVHVSTDRARFFLCVCTSPSRFSRSSLRFTSRSSLHRSDLVADFHRIFPAASGGSVLWLAFWCFWESAKQNRFSRYRRNPALTLTLPYDLEFQSPAAELWPWTTLITLYNRFERCANSDFASFQAIVNRDYQRICIKFRIEKIKQRRRCTRQWNRK